MIDSILSSTSGLAGNMKSPERTEPAPRFVLPGSDGKTYDLSDYLGRRTVVLAWFPKAYTPG
jgi:peroxiredoxin Q/BCP